MFAYGEDNPAKRPEVRKKISEAKKGKKFTLAHRQALSAAKVGKPSNVTGYKHTEETKTLLSKIHKGKRYSPETEFKKGFRPSPETEFKKGQFSKDKHPNWKGGITSKDRLERIRFRREIQKEVFERDNYSCKLCGVESGNLSVDHIQEWADYPELRFNLDNCQTLCMKCHYEKTFKRKLPEGVIWGHNLKRRIAS